MDSREWAEQKLDHGMRPEDVKRVLKDNGHDPEIVDDLLEDNSSGKSSKFVTKGFLISLVLVFGVLVSFSFSDYGYDSIGNPVSADINPLQSCEEEYEYYPEIVEVGNNETVIEVYFEESSEYTEIYQVSVEFDNRGSLQTEELINPDLNRLEYEGHAVEGSVSPVDCRDFSAEFPQSRYITD